MKLFHDLITTRILDFRTEYVVTIITYMKNSFGPKKCFSADLNVLKIEVKNNGKNPLKLPIRECGHVFNKA